LGEIRKGVVSLKNGYHYSEILNWERLGVGKMGCRVDGYNNLMNFNTLSKRTGCISE
jgi:hypothetical protein